ncbi:hypothetical protein HC251_21580 [Iamia sp. SCSIO 61187]|uniref:YncE family protein n=1 Tax=Iamia sp. SCSIO 61187 TaxID=2722752 RepID=UPI001C636088|nr:hypothetical protein [Iamia sp. SCSIO 61187]QYG94767.1 hypothetical protein HC251_21580 [Iamia sp. SCSIO 61187]
MQIGTDMGGLDHEIATSAADALAALGRTEDVAFAPDGRRLAIADFGRHLLVVVDVAVTAGDAGVALTVGRVVEVTATGLDQPHGVAWLDDATLIVGNRAGGLVVLDAPAPPPGAARRVAADPVTITGALAPLDGPGSLAVLVAPDGARELLVCGNWANSITRHRVTEGRPVTVTDAEVWLRRFLSLPDGVAVSPDGCWVAVSNHEDQTVLVYDRTEEASPDERAPVAMLRGTRYPHGLRFTADGAHLLVADAGAPVVNVYRRGPAGWAAASYPTGVLRVMDDATFASGRSRPDEGGPKGLDIDPSGRVLVVTCEGRPLAVFDLAAVLAGAPPIDPATLIPYEVDALDRLAAVRAARTESDLAAMAAESREHDARAAAVRAEEHLQHVQQVAAASDAKAREALRRASEAEERAWRAELVSADLEARLTAAEAGVAGVHATLPGRLARRVLRRAAHLGARLGRSRTAPTR